MFLSGHLNAMATFDQSIKQLTVHRAAISAKILFINLKDFLFTESKKEYFLALFTLMGDSVSQSVVIL